MCNDSVQLTVSLMSLICSCCSCGDDDVAEDEEKEDGKEVGDMGSIFSNGRLIAYSSNLYLVSLCHGRTIRSSNFNRSHCF